MPLYSLLLFFPHVKWSQFNFNCVMNDSFHDHVNITGNPRFHIHVQSRFNVNILTVGETGNKQIYLCPFTRKTVHNGHRFACPVNFSLICRLVFNMTGIFVCVDKDGVISAILGIRGSHLAGRHLRWYSCHNSFRVTPGLSSSLWT